MVIDNIEAEKAHLIQLADDMAAAATTFHGQGYGQFLEAREKCKEGIKHFIEEIDFLQTKLK